MGIQDYLDELKKQVDCGLLQSSSFRSIVCHLAKPTRSNVINGNPMELLGFCTKSLDKRTTQTVFSHVSSYWDWRIENNLELSQINQYRAFRHKYRKRAVFRADFESTTIKVTFQEAEKRINTIQSAPIRNKALELLYTGMRYTESLTLKDGKIMGKGCRKREISLDDKLKDCEKFVGHYDTFRKNLKKIGLKPHDLRRIFATHHASLGRSPYELRRMLGLATILTTQIYVGSFNAKRN